jgi:hypothetical protein
MDTLSIDQQFKKHMRHGYKTCTKEMAEALGFSAELVPDSNFPIGEISKFLGTLHFIPHDQQEDKDKKDKNQGCLIGFYPLTDVPDEHIEDYRPKATFTPWRKRVVVPDKKRFFAEEVLDDSIVMVMVMLPGVTLHFAENMRYTKITVDDGVDVQESATDILTSLNKNYSTNLLLQQHEPLVSIPLDEASRVKFRFGLPEGYYAESAGVTFDYEQILFDGFTQLKTNQTAVKHHHCHLMSVIEIASFTPKLRENEMVVDPKSDDTKYVYPMLEERAEYPLELKALPAVVVTQQAKGKEKKDRKVWISPYVAENKVEVLKVLGVGRNSVTEQPLELRPQWLGVKEGYRIDAENCYGMRSGSDGGDEDEDSEDEDKWF